MLRPWRRRLSSLDEWVTDTGKFFDSSSGEWRLREFPSKPDGKTPPSNAESIFR